MIFDRLQQFRQAAHPLLGRAKDALFDLMDAVLTTAYISSFVMLSLSPLFRRQWPSLYEALQDGRPQRNKLMRLYIEQIPTDQQPVLAGDHTNYPRLDAKTLKDRTYEHQPTSIPGNKPVTIGQGYSTIAWVPEGAGSWALPLRHERITSFESPISKAVFQLKQVSRQLSVRPIVLYDSEFGNGKFAQQTIDIAADILVRLRSNICLWGAPPVYNGKGRPRVHGDKFKLNDPTTWPTPDETLQVEDPKLGTVTVRQWNGLHFRKSPQRPISVLSIDCQSRAGRPRLRPLWTAWMGDPPPPLAQLWPQYLRRGAIDHWYRFAKQRLHWTVPNLETPQQAERWSDLMPLITWQLWLARDGVQDSPLPWQKPQTNLTPGRVAQGFAAILTQLGTPAGPPKPRGKSPGWPAGKPRSPKPRFPVVRKRASKPKLNPQQTPKIAA